MGNRRIDIDMGVVDKDSKKGLVCCYDCSMYPVSEQFLTIDFKGGKHDKTPVVTVHIKNIRNFVSDLRNFQSSNTSTVYSFEETPTSYFDNACCWICHNDVETDDSFVSFPDYDEDKYDELYTCIHKDCIPEFVDKISHAVNQGDFIREML